MIKKETIDQIRASSDIAEVIGGYLPLKKVGKYFRGVCPFHPDKSPSFYVSPERQVYHCFGCGAGGSVINFVMQFEKVDFPEAVKVLAQRLNIPVQVERVNTRYQPLYDACEFAAKFFQRQLPRYQVAINYFLKRGMTDATAARYRLGYAPGGSTLAAEAKKEGFSEELLLKVGLLRARDQGSGIGDQGPEPRHPLPDTRYPIRDWFYARVIFPIMSLSGRVIGFSGRVLDDSEPKYLNSSESEIFHKGENLYGLFQAKNYLRSEVPILVEGNFDLLALVNRGINNVIAPLGTAFTPEQAMLIKRFNNSVRILFDADSAGRNAARRTLEVLIREGLDASVVMLPDDYDPDDYVREFGKSKLAELLAQPLDLVAFLTRLRPAGTITEKNALLRELLQLVALLPDAVMRELFVNRISEQFQVAKDVLAVRVKQAQEGKGSGVRGQGDTRGPKPDTRVPSSKMSREETLLALAAVNPEFARIARRLLPPETFSDSTCQDLASRIYALAESGDLGLARLSDQVEDESLKRRIASWEFLVQELPSVAEFHERALDLKGKLITRPLREAESRQDEAEANRLRRECAEINEQKRLLQKEKS